MNKTIVIVILLTSLTSFAKIEIKNKGSNNNCDVRVFKTKVIKKWNIRKGMWNRISTSTSSIPLYVEDYLSRVGFNPILMPDDDYALEEGDIFIESVLLCRDIGETATWWKCYGDADMYIRTNGLYQIEASVGHVRDHPQGGKGESFELAETGIRNLPVECK